MGNGDLQECDSSSHVYGVFLAFEADDRRAGRSHYDMIHCSCFSFLTDHVQIRVSWVGPDENRDCLKPGTWTEHHGLHSRALARESLHIFSSG